MEAVDRALARKVSLALAVVTILLYWPVHNFQFNNYDDAQYLTQNRHIQHGLTREAVAWAFSTDYAGNWHPLTWLSHLLDVQIYDFNAGGHHLTNLILHTANTVLLFVVLWNWTGAIWRSAFVAALFGWHPMRVESVAWVAERKDVLCGLFWMLTMLAYGKYAMEMKTGNRGKAGKFYGVALFLFALGLMCKPMLVSLPVILLLADYWPLKRIFRRDFINTGLQPGAAKDKETPTASAVLKPYGKPLKRLSSSDADSTGLKPGANGSGARKDAQNIRCVFLEKLPFFALSLVSCWITFLVQNKGGAVQPLVNLSLAGRMENAAVGYIRYMGKLAWPVDLAVLYPLHRNLPPAEVVMAALVLFAISIAAMRWARSAPPLAVGWFWFLITLVPVIGLVQVGDAALADRYSYLPSIGLFMVVAWEAVALCKSRVLLTISAALILGACLIATRMQLPYWHDSVALFTRAVQVTPDNSFAECNLGLALAEQGRTNEAVFHERKAEQINPNNAETHNNLGILLIGEGKLEEASSQLADAIGLNPKFDEPLYNLGLIAIRQGRLEEAIARFRSAIKANPEYDKALANLGIALAQQGHLDEAIAEYRKAVEVAPGNVYAQNALGRALESQNKLEEAAARYEAAIAFKPDFVDAHFNLGNVLLRQHKLPDAAAQFAEAARLQPDYMEAHFNLGLVLEQLGKTSEALQEYAKALDLAQRDREAGSVSEIQKRIEACQSQLAGPKRR